LTAAPYAKTTHFDKTLTLKDSLINIHCNKKNLPKKQQQQSYDFNYEMIYSILVYLFENQQQRCF